MSTIGIQQAAALLRMSQDALMRKARPVLGLRKT